ncbi:MAG: ABC transporter substrate-binding protein [Proteobacteria bacterium]|nr:ABC transporter substrate-binding protein [Pseudomonadota bacterium]
MALALGGCSPAPAPSPVPPAPQRIVSLNPCTDAILAEVADPGAIAGLSAYSSDPAQSSMDVAVARRYPALGGELEEVAALKPDLVLSGNFTPPATRAAMARLGLALAEFPIPRTVAESIGQIRRIAALAGHPDRGEALVARIGNELARAAPPPGSRALPALVWQAGGMVPGRETLISDLLARTGFANFSATRGVAQANILPLEAVLADPPPVILVAANGHAQEDRLLVHPALAGLPHTRRFAFDPVLEWCGGPTIIRAARRLAEVRRATT